jgi:hypothetical protein
MRNIIIAAILVIGISWISSMRSRKLQFKHTPQLSNIRIYKEKWWWNIDRNLMRVILVAAGICIGSVAIVSGVIFIGMKTF